MGLEWIKTGWTRLVSREHLAFAKLFRSRNDCILKELVLADPERTLRGRDLNAVLVVWSDRHLRQGSAIGGNQVTRFITGAWSKKQIQGTCSCFILRPVSDSKRIAMTVLAVVGVSHLCISLVVVTPVLIVMVSANGFVSDSVKYYDSLPPAINLNVHISVRDAVAVCLASLAVDVADDDSSQINALCHRAWP